MGGGITHDFIDIAQGRDQGVGHVRGFEFIDYLGGLLAYRDVCIAKRQHQQIDGFGFGAVDQVEYRHASDAGVGRGEFPGQGLQFGVIVSGHGHLSAAGREC